MLHPIQNKTILPCIFTRFFSEVFGGGHILAFPFVLKLRGEGNSNPIRLLLLRILFLLLFFLTVMVFSLILRRMATGFRSLILSKKKNWVLREGPYGSKWAIEENVKRREMVALEARYIFECSNANNMMDSAPSPLLGFLHFRFTLEEEMPVLYLYELQLDSSVQGKWLGKFLMELVELIAQEFNNLY